ncbi:hypothetical protein [Phreatobacter sp.]|uniref:hypothetical protein n=1 Tax=Phreatobacter sp. TaxID=1966341 RepID=UPI003F6EF347
MPPALLGVAVAAIAIVAYAMVRKAIAAQPQPKPVRADQPIRKLRRDPVTGEYRP